VHSLVALLRSTNFKIFDFSTIFCTFFISMDQHRGA